MDIPRQAQHRTRSFARVLGPFLAILSLVVVVRADDMPALLSEFTASGVWPLVIGAFGLLGGIAIVAFHQFWREPAAIIVSALGWVFVARGLYLLAFPDSFASVADQMIGTVWIWRSASAVLGLIGLYLAYVGWAPERNGLPGSESQKRAESSPIA